MTIMLAQGLSLETAPMRLTHDWILFQYTSMHARGSATHAAKSVGLDMISERKKKKKRNFDASDKNEMIEYLSIAE